MRIVENTPSRVTLRDQKVWGPLLVLTAAGLMFLALAAHPTLQGLWPPFLMTTLSLAFFRSCVVTFDKDRGTCTLTRFAFLRRIRRELALDDIADLRIEPAPRRIGMGSMSCRFSLVAGQEIIPLTTTYEPGPERYRIMREPVLDLVFADRPRPRPAVTEPPETLAESGLTA